MSRCTRGPAPGSRRAAHPAADRGRAVSGSPVVVDGLDVVAVRVEHEGTVVAAVVDGPLARLTVVAVARRHGHAVKLAHGLIVGGVKSDVDVLRRLAAHQGQRTIVALDRDPKSPLADA